MRKRDLAGIIIRRLRVRSINVRYEKLPRPFTADIDGKSITIDLRRVDDAGKLFLLLHLFGHTVQWNVSEKWRRLGMLTVNRPHEELLTALLWYEAEAAQYAQQLLMTTPGYTHALGQWFADYAACDSAYLTHFYRTGEKKRFLSFWKDGTPLIFPKRIPPFTPRVWGGRNGVVI